MEDQEKSRKFGEQTSTVAASKFGGIEFLFGSWTWRQAKLAHEQASVWTVTVFTAREPTDCWSPLFPSALPSHPPSPSCLSFSFSFSFHPPFCTPLE